MKSFLIKRSADFTNNGFIKKNKNKNKIYIETKISKKPTTALPLNFKEKDQIFIAEKGIGIYAFGTITKIEAPISILGINDFLKHVEKKGDEVYWMNRLLKYYNASEKELDKTKKIFNCQEYVVDQQLMERTIPLQGKLSRLSQPGFASSVIELTPDEVDFIKQPIFESTEIFKLDIPSSLRMDIYSFVNKNYSVQHYIDIDHLVPKSVGGPGNIIENLVPIGLSLNRYKNNDIPIGLFVIANHYGLGNLFNLEYIKDLNKLYISNKKKNKNDIYQKNDQFLDDARKIINYVMSNFKPMEVRHFFANILKYHYPEYSNSIKNFIKTYR